MLRQQLSVAKRELIPMKFLVPILACLGIVVANSGLLAADWPMWRCDANRSAETGEKLPEKLNLQWVRRYPPLKPAYRNARLQFDAGYEPVVLGKTMFVASSRNDSLTAIDTKTGVRQWRFYAEGPVRFAAVAWKENVYFGSDDGHLYCLDAQRGKLRWKFRAVPSRRRLMAGGRLISVWPVRGGPVLADGKIYFAAGVWPFEGVFVYCLDAKTGSVVWLNDRSGFLYGQHPHNTVAFGGVTPQGYLVIHNDELIVPCGSALPARFDLHTGKLKSFALPKQGRYPGGWFAAAAKARRRGKGHPGKPEIVFDLEVNKDRHESGWNQGPGESGIRSTISAGDREFSFEEGFPGVNGTVHSMLVADEKLFVVTREGGIYCFGHKTAQPKSYPDEKMTLPRPEDGWRRRAAEILKSTGAKHGYALVWGVGTGRLLEELAFQSELNIIAVDPGAKKVAALRRRLDEAGLYATRVTLHVGSPSSFGFPPYVASLIVSEDLAAAGFASGSAFARQVFDSLRPYGGAACLFVPSKEREKFKKSVRQARLANAELKQAEDFTLLTRIGGLPGATNYTGGWSSPDKLVKAPLGVLWFDDTVGHFKRAPQPKFVDGVMISHDKSWKGWVTGDRPPYTLTTETYMDVYTGRVLSQGDSLLAGKSFPHEDVNRKQPEQYRPASQKDPWKPEKPVVGERVNPLTGLTEPRSFPKNYGCDRGNDYGFLYTMRSGTAAYYDKRIESGTVYISGPRSGCTNSIIPANGLLNVPYFYQGCTCSYPLPVGLAMVAMPQEYEQWTVWGGGNPGVIGRVGINFGAPGDRVTEAGTLWLDYPSVGGPSPHVAVTTVPKSPSVFYRHSLWIEGGRGWPWVAASGLEGVSAITIGGLKKSSFTVRFYFAEPDHRGPGKRVFDVSLEGKPVLENFDVVREAGGRMRVLVKEFKNVRLTGTLTVNFTARVGSPLLCGIEIVADGLPLGELPMLKELQPRQLVARERGSETVSP